MLKQQLPPRESWFDDIQVLVDLGYLGMAKDYNSDNVHLPFSTTNAETELGKEIAGQVTGWTAEWESGKGYFLEKK
jgi:hypothetical protein